MDSWRRREAGLAIMAWLPFAATAGPSLRIATDANDQSGVGPAGRAVLSRAFERLGVAASFEPFPLRRSLRMTEQGLLDGEALRIRAIAEGHPQLLAVPVPIATVKVVGYARTPGALPRDGAALSTLRVGYPRGVVLIEKLVADMPHKQEATTQADLLRLLRRQAIDVALLTLASGQPLPDPAQFAELAPLPAPLSVTPLHLLLNVRHRALLPRLAATLREMEDSGESARLRDAAWSAWAATLNP